MACNCRLSLSASSSGTLVDHKTITGVPLTTRNFAQVLSMTSGTAADVNNAGTLGRGTSTVNVNGSTAAGSYTIEGAYAPSTVPNPDTIAEFKIQTSQYDAGYGAHGAQHQRDHPGRRESRITAPPGNLCATTFSMPTRSFGMPPDNPNPI